MARIRSGKGRTWDFTGPFPTITGGIFEPGFPDCFLQMWAAFLAERAGLLGAKFGCVHAGRSGFEPRAFCGGPCSRTPKNAPSISPGTPSAIKCRVPSLCPMKRSDINFLFRSASQCFAAHDWALPPECPMGCHRFRSRRLAALRPRVGQSGGGAGILREAHVCRKRHDHTGPHAPERRRKTSSAGGAGWRSGSGRDIRTRLAIKSLSIPVNHEPRTIASGAILELPAGSRVTLLPGVYHEFYPLSEECIIGEVSTANDDRERQLLRQLPMSAATPASTKMRPPKFAS